MNSVFISNDLAEHYASFKMLSVLAVGCIGWGVLVLLSGKCRKLVNNRLKFKYLPLFKDLLNKHIYSNKDLYNTSLEYISLPLDEFREHNLSRRSIRQILVNTILDYLHQSPDEKKKLLKKLYRDLDLELYTILDLDTLKGQSLVSAIEELMVMDIVVDKPVMARFLAHKEVTVQKITEKYLHRIHAIVKEDDAEVNFNSFDDRDEELELQVAEKPAL